ncbi:OmpA family protein [Psychromonas sp. KJ10-10]|uniref:OmpA family protein n=1 Tax=Psychromonas sp. KJ10-10 TaxID=3391823 RepID=UPI0039B5655C
MYVPAYGNAMALDFSRYIVSIDGQNVVDQIGFVSQNIQLEETYKVINAPEKYNQYAEVASRLSVNFHFQSGSNEFDNKAKVDIKRLAEYLSRHRGRRVVLMGFSDSLGDPEMNVRISLLRAGLLEKELNAYGLTITAVEGFGAELPIASNETVAGRSKNRRVEVWVY